MKILCLFLCATSWSSWGSDFENKPRIDILTKMFLRPNCSNAGEAKDIAKITHAYTLELLECSTKTHRIRVRHITTLTIHRLILEVKPLIKGSTFKEKRVDISTSDECIARSITISPDNRFITVMYTDILRPILCEPAYCLAAKMFDLQESGKNKRNENNEELLDINKEPVSHIFALADLDYTSQGHFICEYKKRIPRGPYFTAPNSNGQNSFIHRRLYRNPFLRDITPNHIVLSTYQKAKVQKIACYEFNREITELDD